MIALDNGVLRLTLNEDVGGTITAIRHLESGLSVLGQVPWQAEETPLPGGAARDEPQWLTRYTGGWPLLFPNAGDACEADGVFHGFHGEASISRWDATAAVNTAILRRRFDSVPVAMRRTIALDGDTVIVDEELQMLGATPAEVMWGHHPTFGSDLLDSPVEITSGAARVTADAAYDPAANPLLPGASGGLDVMPGKRGPVDLSHPSGPLAALLYLEDFGSAWAAIRRLDDAVAVQLSWDQARFPVAWVWYELQGTADPPWHGHATLIGLEPNTTKPAYGLAQAKAAGGNLLRLEPGSRHSARLSLRVFRPRGPLRSNPP